MLGFLVGEALRDLRRAGRVAVGAVLMIALSLVVLGVFWVLGANLGRAVAEWRGRVRIIVYLKREPGPSEVAALLGRIRALPEVGAARYVGKAEALASLRRTLGKDAGVVDELASNPLPASIEVAPTAAGATPEQAPALLARLTALPEAEEVAGAADWVERLAHWQRLLGQVGLGVGATLALAAILTVTSATSLVLHARQREAEIMRLVGAPELVIRLPLLMQGMLQGLLGAVVALALLIVLYRMAAPGLEPLVRLTLGLPALEFLPAPSLVALAAAGTVLGGLGGWLARGRGEW